MNTPDCRLCSSPNTDLFFELPPVPTQDGIMCTTESKAKSVNRGKISLVYCDNCGFISNDGYDPSKIQFDDYDFSNDHSPLFRSYVKSLSERLSERYDLKGKTILDIGSGDGAFLETICRLGNNIGIGIDPGFDHSTRKVPEDLEVTYIRDYYSEKYANVKTDLLTCRLVIDLLEDQTKFLKMVRDNLNEHPETIVYFEVPNAQYTFEDRILWNVVYEHGAWYTKQSLAYQFRHCGFEVLHVDTCWNDEFLGIEAKPDQNYQRSPQMSKIVDDFKVDVSLQMEDCKKKIVEIIEKETRTIAWGAGARAVTFFNLFDVKEQISQIVDINKKRHGKYLPGSGQKIISPDEVVAINPELIIITNPTYAVEIKEHVHRLGIQPEFWVL